jgi:hypothetical protein
VVGRYDLGGHATTPLGATRLVRHRLSDEGKSRPIGPGFLDGSARKRQPLPRPAICWRPAWYASFDAHPGAREFVARPAVHVIQNIRRAGGMVILVDQQHGLVHPGADGLDRLSDLVASLSSAGKPFDLRRGEQ